VGISIKFESFTMMCGVLGCLDSCTTLSLTFLVGAIDFYENDNL